MNIHKLVKKRQRMLWMSMVAAALSLLGCQERVIPGGESVSEGGGSMDETSTLAFYKPDGRPAAGARVLVYSSSDTTAVPKTQVFTGSNGSVTLPSLPNGYYNLVVKDGSGFAAFQDSLVSDGVSLPFRSDTLVRMGGLRGRIRVQPQHDPRSVWLAVLGAGIYLNLDDSGRFEIPSVPEGKFSLMLYPEVKGYTRTFLKAEVHRDSMTDLGEIPMVYTGLPVATDVRGEWDSLGGFVKVAWNPSNSNKVLGWKVHRKLGDSPDAPSVKVADLGPEARTWVDQVFDKDLIESTTIPLRYWIQAIGGGIAPGEFHGSWAVKVESPYLVTGLHPAWSRQGAAVGCLGEGVDEKCPLDTLKGGGLAYLATRFGSVGGSDTAELRVSTDGNSWKTVWRATGPVLRGRGRDTADFGEAPLWEPRRGIFHRGRFVWAESKFSDRREISQAGIISGVVVSPLADSFVIHSIGVDGSDQPRMIVAMEKVNKAILLGQGDSIAIMQVHEAFNFVSYKPIIYGDLSVRQTIIPSGSVSGGGQILPWISEGLSWSSRTNRSTLAGPMAFDGPEGRWYLRSGEFESRHDGSPLCSLSTRWNEGYQALPRPVSEIALHETRIYFHETDWMAYADRKSPLVWHQVELPSVEKLHRSVFWGGRMWLFTSTGIWSAPQP